MQLSFLVLQSSTKIRKLSRPGPNNKYSILQKNIMQLTNKHLKRTNLTFLWKKCNVLLIVQFRIHHDRWIQGLTTHLYRVSLDLKKNVHKYRREGDTNLKIKQYTEL